jgi:hypothetical protein
MPPPIYHITKLANLEGIIGTGELFATNRLHRDGAGYASIAYDHIQERRARYRVPCGPRGVLHDYVPFYFAPRSPMLYTISRGNISSCPEGQRPILHLVADVEAIDAAGIRYVFTDGHAVMAFSRFFEDLARLDQIDWAIMREHYWNDTLEDGDRKRRRQAEFLVHESLPWELVSQIGVISNQIRERVVEILAGAAHQPEIVVRSNWYY